MAGELKYRADIDGLRSIAVVPVVLYHAGVPMFGGGYVGVDIFFVISGYLITGILLQSIDSNSLSILDFYERRIRRIFPALLLVLACSTVAAWFLFTPASLISYGQSLAWVTIFGSNFHFWQSVDYFSAGAHVQPLLHTWSLAVEEQFYIFFPAFLLILSRLRLNLVPVLLAIGILSLVAACVLLPRMPGAVFYLLPTRTWELVIGGLIACGFPRPAASIRVAGAAALAGLALTVLPIALYRADTPFPGLAAIPPTLGAALIIWSGGPGRQSGVHQLLSMGPMVAVGRASYSFYLWHFPIFAFAAYLLGGHFGIGTGLVLALGALLAAFATLRWVETPSRRIRSRRLTFAWLLPMMPLGVAGLVLARSDGFASRLPDAAARYADTERDKQRHHDECMSNGSQIVDPARACLLGARDSQPHVLLWGDSHAMVTSAAMEAAALAQGKSLLFAASADCPPGLGFHISPEFQTGLTRTPSYRYCQSYNEKMLALALGDRRIDTVVISARWSNWRIGEPGNPVESPVDMRLADSAGTARSAAENAVKFESGFVRLLTTLHAAGKRIYIVGPLPEPPVAVPQALFAAHFGLVDPPAPLTMAEFNSRHARALAILDRAGKKVPVTMIWPHRLICESATCPLEHAGRPTFFDHNHLSLVAARQTAPAYAPVFDLTERQ